MAEPAGSLPMLKHFIVYNPTFDKSEATEHEKLLFYWPQDVPQEKKMNAVGLGEALVKYTTTFSDIPCEVLRTKKTRHIFYRPEPDCWMTISVDLPYSERPGKDGTMRRDTTKRTCRTLSSSRC